MAKYALTSPFLCRELRDLRSQQPDAPYLYCYFKINRHATSEGFYEIALPTVAHESGLSIDEVQSALRVLERRHVAYDRTAEVFLDRYGLRWYQPAGNQLKGAVSRFQQVPDTALKWVFYNLAFEYARDLHDKIEETCTPDTPEEKPALWIDERPSNALATPSERRTNARVEKSRVDKGRAESSRGSPVSLVEKALGAEVVSGGGRR